MNEKDYKEFFNEGKILLSKKSIDNSIEYFKKSLQLNENFAEGFFYLSLAFYQKYYISKDKTDSQFKNANYISNLKITIDFFKKALYLNPEYTGINHYLANLYVECAMFNEAISCYNSILSYDKTYFLAYALIGKCLFFDHEEKEALKYFEIALSFNTDLHRIFYILADLYKKQGLYFSNTNSYYKAADYYLKAIEHSPQRLDYYYEVSELYKKIGENDKAIDFYKLAIDNNPDDIYPLINLAYKYLELFRIKDAIEILEKAYKINNTNPKLLMTMASAYIYNYETEKGYEYIQKAIDADISPEILYTNTAAAFLETAKPDEAIDFYRKAIEQNPEDMNKAECNLGYALLLSGKWEEGFKLYEKRNLLSENLKKRIPEFGIKDKKWNGENLKGKTLYVYFEQGLGDQLQFVRYINILNEMGAQVLLKVNSGLTKLFEENIKCDIVAENVSYKYLKYDYHCSIMSLPYLLNVSTSNISYSGGYLSANKEKVLKYYDKYFNNDKFKVGIAWEGSHTGLNNRNIAFEKFQTLFKLENIAFYSFQKNYTNINLKNTNITDLGNTFNDFSDTAAAMENIDLFISSDTSVLHLAGAMGKQARLLLPYAPEWRWLMDREDTPWYKTVKLIRQEKPYSWDEPINKVFEELKSK